MSIDVVLLTRASNSADEKWRNFVISLSRAFKRNSDSNESNIEAVSWFVVLSTGSWCSGADVSNWARNLTLLAVWKHRLHLADLRILRTTSLGTLIDWAMKEFIFLRLTGHRSSCWRIWWRECTINKTLEKISVVHVVSSRVIASFGRVRVGSCWDWLGGWSCWDWLYGSSWLGGWSCWDWLKGSSWLGRWSYWYWWDWWKESSG